MNLEFVPDFQINKTTSDAIKGLLSACFPDEDFHGRDYFKQVPHHRIIAYEADRLVGQLSIDNRVMNLNVNLNGQAVNVFGVIDLCVTPDRQGMGIGTALLQEFETIARGSSRIDFLFLVSKTPLIYKNLGYKTTTLQVSWMKIHEVKQVNYGVATEQISDAFFCYKEISDKRWKDGELDLLGYMY